MWGQGCYETTQWNCEIGCDRIVPGADDCSASKKVKVSKWQKEFGL